MISIRCRVITRTGVKLNLRATHVVNDFDVSRFEEDQDLRLRETAGAEIENATPG